MKSLKPNDLGKRFLVEESQRISITSYIRTAQEKLKGVLITAEIEVGNTHIELVQSKTAFGGTRYWFKCPLCERRAGMLYIHPFNAILGCRACLNLEYRSRRYKGMVENNKIKG